MEDDEVPQTTKSLTRKGKRKEKIGRAMFELKQDLNPREFLKDMHIGSKKKEKKVGNEKIDATKNAEAPQTPEPRKTRPSLGGLKAWTTLSWSGGRRGKEEPETEIQQPRRMLKGQKMNSQRDVPEAGSVSPRSKKASVKAKSGASSSPKKKRNSLKLSAKSDSKKQVMDPPESPKKVKKAIKKTALSKADDGDTGMPPKSPKKKKSVLKASPIVDTSNTEPPAGSKKSAKKKKSKGDNDSKELAEATDQTSPSENPTKGKKKKANKKKEEGKDTAAETPNEDKATAKKKKAKKQKAAVQ